MHIAEGFLPPIWAILWTLLSLPFVAYGIQKLNKTTKENPESKSLIVVSGAFIFVLSSLSIPSIVGTSSHPLGITISSVLFGPFITAVLSTIVLFYQALFLGHGGLTTLGANIFSMGIIGPFVAYWTYKWCQKLNINALISIFIATITCNIATYLITAIQLVTAIIYLPNAVSFIDAFMPIIIIFTTIQTSIAVVEGIITAVIFKFIIDVKSSVLIQLKVIKEVKS
ncbi:MAG: energy-coupling factor ABC transporter permease [Methanosarcinaceae archaeon]|nr:energy-coupling factor ABC transporter permease [Methanosarcinaceae archaeon]